MSTSIFQYRITHNPRRRAHRPCARCGISTIGIFGAGNAHVGAMFCGDMECYVTASEVSRLATLPLSTIYRALVALRRTGTAVIEGRAAQELWQWIEEHRRQGGESEAAA